MTAADRAEHAVPEALQLVDAVKRWNRRDVEGVLADADLPALCVVLAAMVNDEARLDELLGWTAGQDQGLDGWTWPDVLDAHADWERHRHRGLTAPDRVREGQRIYDRVRARRRRAGLKAVS